MNITFEKWEGAGNDFIIIDNRQNGREFSSCEVAKLCHRKLGIGADGLILLNSCPNNEYGFTMIFFNPDGSRAPMCGNGGRCVAAFAHTHNIQNLNFMADDGPHTAEILSVNSSTLQVKLKMCDVHNIRPIDNDKLYIDTGTDHLVIFTDNIDEVPINEIGPKWRYNTQLFPKGTNVNFVERVSGVNGIKVRTYERGVEAETLACGTGITASAIATFIHSQEPKPTECPQRYSVEARGGKLSVDFTPHHTHNALTFTDVYLTGPARQSFIGEIIIK